MLSSFPSKQHETMSQQFKSYESLMRFLCFYLESHLELKTLKLWWRKLKWEDLFTVHKVFPIDGIWFKLKQDKLVNDERTGKTQKHWFADQEEVHSRESVNVALRVTEKS